MAAIYEEFIRCSKCGHPDFKEEAVFTFHKLVKARENEEEPLPHLERKIVYVCRECGTELNK